MISHKYKCIFIHIPKCAGTSIESALGHFETYDGIGAQDHRSIRMIEQPLLTPHILSSLENVSEVVRRVRHKYTAQINPRNKFTVTKEQYKTYYKFTFIRNPWSRAFSLYKNVMRSEIHQKNFQISGDLSFKDFLRFYSGKGMLRQQTYWLKSFDGSIGLNYIGRFESLVEDFQKICREIDIPQSILPKKLKGSGEDYLEHYDDESIDIISKVYEEEIKMFDYSFDFRRNDVSSSQYSGRSV